MPGPSSKDHTHEGYRLRRCKLEGLKVGVFGIAANRC